MFQRSTIYEIWNNSLCRFGVNPTFWYVVCEHLHNLEEGVSCLTVFCFRIESLLPKITRYERLITITTCKTVHYLSWSRKYKNTFLEISLTHCEWVGFFSCTTTHCEWLMHPHYTVCDGLNLSRKFEYTALCSSEVVSEA